MDHPARLKNSGNNKERPDELAAIFFGELIHALP